MSQGLAEIHSRLRAADRALAFCQGGSSELARVREATGALLVALHELVDLWEKRELAPGGLAAPEEAAAPTRGRGAKK